MSRRRISGSKCAGRSLREASIYHRRDPLLFRNGAENYARSKTFKRRRYEGTTPVRAHPSVGTQIRLLWKTRKGSGRPHRLKHHKEEGHAKGHWTLGSGLAFSVLRMNGYCKLRNKTFAWTTRRRCNFFKAAAFLRDDQLAHRGLNGRHDWNYYRTCTNHRLDSNSRRSSRHQSRVF